MDVLTLTICDYRAAHSTYVSEENVQDQLVQLAAAGAAKDALFFSQQNGGQRVAALRVTGQSQVLDKQEDLQIHRFTQWIF